MGAGRPRQAPRPAGSQPPFIGRPGFVLTSRRERTCSPSASRLVCGAGGCTRRSEARARTLFAFKSRAFDARLSLPAGTTALARCAAGADGRRRRAVQWRDDDARRDRRAARRHLRHQVRFLSCVLARERSCVRGALTSQRAQARRPHAQAEAQAQGLGPRDPRVLPRARAVEHGEPQGEEGPEARGVLRHRVARRRAAAARERRRCGRRRWRR